MYTYIYIYIYIYTLRLRRLDREKAALRAGFGAKKLHARNHKSELPLENAAEIHRAILVNNRWTSDNPLENTTDK